MILAFVLRHEIVVRMLWGWMDTAVAQSQGERAVFIELFLSLSLTSFVT
jgi:hypothetical protein